MEQCCSDEGTQAAYSQMLGSFVSWVRSQDFSWSSEDWDLGEIFLTTLLVAHLVIIVLFVCSRGTIKAFLQ
jgi:hypothetical protein